MEPTGTNRPRTWPHTVQAAPRRPPDVAPVVPNGLVVTVVMAEGKHPVTFRTRKLSLPAPMVLHLGGCGRVGRCRTAFCGGPWSLWLGAFAFFQAFSVRFRARLRPRPHDALWRTAPGFPGAFSFGPVDAAPGVSGTGRGRAADRTRGWSGHAREQEWSRASVGFKRGISCG